MKVWKVDGDFVEDNSKFGEYIGFLEEVRDPEISFAKIVDKAWPEKVMFWNRPFRRGCSMADRHDDAQSWQCGAICPKDVSLWCHRTGAHRGKCSDILSRTDRIKIAKKIRDLQFEEFDAIYGKKPRLSARRYSLAKLKATLKDNA